MDRAPRSNFLCVPRMALLPSDGQSNPDALVRRRAIFAARNMATSDAPLKTTLTASTQLFAAPRRAPQFRIVQVHVKTRPRVDRYRRRQSLQAPGTAPKRERRDVFFFCQRGRGRAFAMHGPVQGARSSRTICMTKDGCVCVICGSASAAASGRPEVREDVGDCSAHDEGQVTQHGSIVVRLSVWDRVAVGGGRMYTAVIPRSSWKASSRATVVRCTKSRALGNQGTPSHTT